MESIKEFKEKLAKSVVKDCPYYVETNSCKLGVAQPLFSGGMPSVTCTKNPDCLCRKYKLEEHRRLVAQELLSDTIKELKKQKELRKNETKHRSFAKNKLTYAEKEFGRVLNRARQLLAIMEDVQNQSEKGSQNYIVSRTIITIIKKAFGPYARKQMKGMVQDGK